MKLLALTQVALLLAISTDEPPSEFRIFAKGENKTTKGTVVFDAQSAKLVPAAYAEHGVELFIDYEHKSILSTPAVDGGKAAGWFKPEVRDGELWASDVKWTPAAETAIRSKEYRYFSPVVLHDAKGRVHKLVNVALTNLPATKNLRALVASDAPNQGHKTMDEELALLFTALQVDSSSKALGVITALREEADKVKTLSARVAELELQIASRDVEMLLLDAKEAGKVSEAELPKLREMGVKDVAWLSGYLAIKSPAPAATPEHKEPLEQAGNTKLSALELKAIELAGIPAADFLKERERLALLDAKERQLAAREAN